jgi:YD repeat-containing protein
MDHLDNVKENIVVHRYYYNELSQLTELKFINYPNAIGTQLPFEFIETNPTESFSGNYILSYEYNENGQVTVKKVVAIGSGDVLNKITAAYNEDGTLATLTDMSNGGDTAVATYVYDSQQRVTEIQVAIDARKDGQRTYTYEYDANGNLILGKLFEIYDNDGKTEYGDSVTAEYTYTADGKLESCTHTFYNLHSHDGSIYTETKDVYTYEYDGQGRIVKATVVPGDEIQASNGDVAYQGKAKYAKAEHEFVYGDYYIYNGK